MTTLRINKPNRPRPMRWTADQYWRLFELGFFAGRSVELINGEIVEMASQKNPHAISVINSLDAVRAAFGAGYFVRVQASLNLSPIFVPDPDIAVVAGDPSTYLNAPVPTTALLVIEISDSTLWMDRNRKSRLYAHAGIADYWIVNLQDQTLEVRRDPRPNPSRPNQFVYGSVSVYTAADRVAPPAAPNATIAVADLLP